MNLLLDEGPYMLKFIFALFLIVILRLQVSLHFHTLRQENMMEQVSYILRSHFFLKQKKPSLISLSSVYLSVSFLSVNRYILKIADIF